MLSEVRESKAPLSNFSDFNKPVSARGNNESHIYAHTVMFDIASRPMQRVHREILEHSNHVAGAYASEGVGRILLHKIHGLRVIDVRHRGCTCCCCTSWCSNSAVSSGERSVQPHKNGSNRKFNLKNNKKKIYLAKIHAYYRH